MIYSENNKHLDKCQIYNFKDNPFVRKNSKEIEDKIKKGFIKK